MRIYAIEEGTGRRVLIALECDECGARTAPGPAIVTGGWERRGIYYGPKDSRNSEIVLCPKCASTDGLGRS